MLLRTTTMMFELRNVMSKYLLLFLINSSAIIVCCFGLNFSFPNDI